ncbi:DUF3105 domain-containing protein [Streptomyces canus]|uniref:DUF3105 domain-containing protein n=1 Tax=Streptomyces canus TaxID=58343 RepID=UPI00037AD47C|nr:DUF3105 domain-containing protein [Streptomyces canus]
MSQDQRQHTPAPAGRDDETRRARLAELRDHDARRARRTKRLRTAATTGSALAAAVAVVAVVLSVQGRPEKDTAADSGIDPTKANVRGEKVYDSLDRLHVKGEVDYPRTPWPPVGGRHDPRWQNANGDVYTRPLREENAVHALEHGAVWVTYSRALPKAEVEKLRAKVAGVPYRMMSPLPDQPGRVELTAWGHQLTVDSADDPRVDEFFDAYVQGPQAPEEGAPVTGGKATP